MASTGLPNPSAAAGPVPGVTVGDAVPASDQDTARALGGYVLRQTGASALAVTAFSRLTGGAIQDNYALTVDCEGGTHSGVRKLVVRSDAPSQVAASLTRAQEFRVLQLAFEAGVTVPEPLWLCEDKSVIGAPFCVMAWVPGTASGRALVRGVTSAEQGRDLVRQLGTELARLHQVRPPDDRLSFLKQPDGVPALGRVREYRAALDAIPRPHPVLEWALNWLEDHAPDSGLRALCHGDFRSGNYMVHEGRVTGVLDWEFASWGDPFEDLGWLCARSWRFGAPEREVGGIGDKADLFAAWESGSGRKVDEAQVCYWEVMGMVRWAIIALQQGQRHLSGEQASLELALTGRMLPEIEFDILCRIDELEGRERSPVIAEAAARPQPAPLSALSVPDGADLLATARRVLLDELLPQLPRDRTYEALMVANAMAIAARELDDLGRLADEADAAIRAFLAQAGEDPLVSEGPDGAGGAQGRLARMLRARRVAPGHAGELRRLLMAQTCARLRLSNPKHLAAPPAGAAV